MLNRVVMAGGAVVGGTVGNTRPVTAYSCKSGDKIAAGWLKAINSLVISPMPQYSGRVSCQREGGKRYVPMFQ